MTGTTVTAADVDRLAQIICEEVHGGHERCMVSVGAVQRILNVAWPRIAASGREEGRDGLRSWLEDMARTHQDLGDDYAEDQCDFLTANRHWARAEARRDALAYIEQEAGRG